MWNAPIHANPWIPVHTGSGSSVDTASGSLVDTGCGSLVDNVTVSKYYPIFIYMINQSLVWVRAISNYTNRNLVIHIYILV